MRLWRARLAPDQTERIVVRVALSSDTIVGFACVLPDIEPASGARLDNLHVHPEYKAHGVGTRLFDVARADGLAHTGSPLFHLWVLEANVQARSFYERRGGVAADQRTFELVPSVTVPEIRYVWR